MPPFFLLYFYCLGYFMTAAVPDFPEKKEHKSTKSYMQRLRDYLITGLLIWLPISLTIWVVSTLIGSMDQFLLLLPAHMQPKALFGFDIPGLGAVLVVLLILATGLFAANVLGKKLVYAFEWLMSRTPGIKGIYNSIKQVSDTLLSDSGNAFREAVLVQFPHPGCWAIAFVTGKPAESLNPHLSVEDYVSVYVPTTPNPTGGYFIMIKKSDVRVLDMSVDTALKYIISMGVVTPN
jgi:uncharacterized membrane protein